MRRSLMSVSLIFFFALPWALASEGATSEEVTIAGAEGFSLAATFSDPDGESLRPGVLLLHMLGSNRHAWDGFAADLVQAGYAVLALDLRGHGDSVGTPDWPKAQEDTRLAWRYLADRPEVDARRTAVIGASIGANLALTTSAALPQIATVALLSPGLDYQGVTTEDALAAYGDRPALIIASQGDRYAAGSSRTLIGESTSSDSQLIIYQGSAHGTRIFGAEPSLAPTLLAWLEQHLGPPTSR